MTFCLRGLIEMCLSQLVYQMVSDSGECIEFAGCRRGGSQWACLEIACAPLFQVWYHIPVLLAMIYLFHDDFFYYN